MRVVCIGLLAGVLCLGAGSAQALSITPNPVHEGRAAGSPGGSLSADLSAVSVSGNTATFQVTVSTGTITGIDISMLFDDIDLPTSFDFVIGASFAGSGVGGTAAVAPGGSEAQFDFATPIAAGQSSRQLVVTFASPIPLGWEGAVDFDNGYATTERYAVSAPEPVGLVLLGAGLGALAFARRAAK